MERNVLETRERASWFLFATKKHINDIFLCRTRMPLAYSSVLEARKVRVEVSWYVNLVLL